MPCAFILGQWSSTGVLFPPGENVAMSGDIFSSQGCRAAGRGEAELTSRAKSPDAVKYPTMHRTVPQ